MRKPNWKRQGFKSKADMQGAQIGRNREQLRKEALLRLPPELREEIAKQPQLLKLIP